MVLGVLCHLAHGNGLGKGTEGKEKKKKKGMEKVWEGKIISVKSCYSHELALPASAVNGST